MKTLAISLILIISSFLSFAQQDPEAKKILDQISEKTKTYKSIQIVFSYIFENKTENIHDTVTGEITIKGKKYKLKMLNYEIYYDGKTMWNYLPADAEVTISEPVDDEESLTNPANLLTIYDKGFKYRYNGLINENKREFHEIDLFPKNPKEKKYFKVQLIVDKKTLNITKFITSTKDGSQVIVEVENMKTDIETDDSKFVFKPTPDIEINDMRR